MTTGIVDLHVHTAPSLAPRHGRDLQVAEILAALGVDRFVLKAHEGSTAARAALSSPSAVGGIVLNSPVGGANPDAVEVAARLGARVVWLPTASSVAHQDQATEVPGHEVHSSFRFRAVPVRVEGGLAPGWDDVLDVVAAHDMVLASGHVPMGEAVAVFTEARRRGVARFLVNHPLLPYLGWSARWAEELRALSARVEVGVLADRLAGSVEAGTGRLAREYPTELLVFGSDLGFAGYPTYEAGYRDWIGRAEAVVGAATVARIMTSNGAEVLR